MTDLICKFCNKECKNKNSFSNHVRLCPKNEDRIYQSYTIGIIAWNKGKTSETDDIVNQITQKLIIRSKENGAPFKGKRHKPQAKEKLSIFRKKFLEENPDKVPYLLNHSSKGPSKAEQYFIDLFKKEGKEYQYHYRILTYQIDFADILNKIAIEIDGEQHYVDERIVLHDITRTERLLNEGWKTIRIRWSEYQKIPYDKRHEYLISAGIL